MLVVHKMLAVEVMEEEVVMEMVIAIVITMVVSVAN